MQNGVQPFVLCLKFVPCVVSCPSFPSAGASSHAQAYSGLRVILRVSAWLRRLGYGGIVYPRVNTLVLFQMYVLSVGDVLSALWPRRCYWKPALSCASVNA